jgi:hypothetical protein
VKVRVSNLNIIEWRIQLLGRNGGFSYKAIANEVFGKYTKTEKQLIYKALRKAGIQLKDWRNLESSVAKKYIRLTKRAIKKTA